MHSRFLRSSAMKAQRLAIQQSNGKFTNGNIIMSSGTSVLPRITNPDIVRNVTGVGYI